MIRIPPEVRLLARFLAQTRSLPGPAIDVHHDEVDWNRWMDVVDQHRLGPYLGSRLTASQLERMPGDVVEELQRQYAMEAREGLIRASAIRRIIDLLHGRVEYAALKGSMLSWTLYQEAAERPLVDVDLLIRSADELERAQEILEEAGFTMGKGYAQHHHLPPMTDRAHSLAIELHRNLSTPPLRIDIIQTIWERRIEKKIGGIPTVTVLDPVCNLFHLCIHALNDPVDSPLLRDLFEIACLITQLSSSEKKDFTNIVKTWHLVGHVSHAVELAHQLFGSPLITPQPHRGAIDFWCLRRLSWHANTRWTGLEKHLARQHIEKIQFGAGNRSPLPLLSILTTTGWTHLRQAPAQIKQRLHATP
ncbi:MAG: hypothetical protein ACI97B_004497, partial [Verrucomicrobiales bacterium]